MIAVTFRPLDPLSAELKPNLFPTRSPFSASWSSTLDLLDRELRALDAENVVVQLALDESQLRLDGWPRSEARPEHSGVALAFESRYGALQYMTGVYAGWQQNLRAIALGLEALRRVDRYGITKSGEQYRGWKQLPASADAGISFSGPDDARHFLAELAGCFASEDVASGAVSDQQIVRAALKKTHPDKGGSSRQFAEVQVARKVLGV